MSRKPLIIVVGADKGGVGKTTVTRTLLDYLTDREIPFRPFDTEYPNGDLTRFNAAPVVDISSIEGQMEVFDGIGDAITVVDIRAGLLSPTIQALDDAQLLADVRAGAVDLVLLHVLGPSLASISEVASAAAAIGNAKHLLVKNHINKTKYSLSGIPGADEVFAKYADVTVVVGQLPEKANEELQELAGQGKPASFSDYVAAARSRTLSGHVRTWLSSVWAEYDRVGILPALEATPAEPQASWGTQ
jgi:hypothetical protein